MNVGDKRSRCFWICDSSPEADVVVSVPASLEGASEDQGISSSLPVVARLAMSAWAFAASASG